MCCRRKAGWKGSSWRRGRAGRWPVSRLALLGAVTGEPHFVETKTDKDGRFKIAGLGEDSYDIEIVGANLPEAVVIGNSAFFGQELPEWIGSQQEIHVEAGKPAPSIKIEAIKGGTAELVLTDRATGKPIASPAVLYVSSTADRRSRHFGMAPKDGVAKLYLRRASTWSPT